MSIHESSVNYENLIRDLADMYPFEVAEVVIVELVANSLDVKATNISIDYDHHNRILVVTDDGKGMNASQFDEYHDFAAGLKTRGSGIGFAGVGAKISFNIANRVETETRSNSFSGASVWYLQSKKKLVWEDSQPSHLQNNGTRVEIHLSPDSAPSYSNTLDIIQLLKRHYLPLFDKTFLEIYDRAHYYSSNLRFKVNGQNVLPGEVTGDLELESVKKFVPTKNRKRMGYGVFGLSKQDYSLGPGICGVLLCTRGKVIKAELFNQFPGDIGPKMFGVVEIPSFVNFLTTSRGREREAAI